MTTKTRKNDHPAEDTHAGKEFSDIAERVFADDTPPQPLYAPVLEDSRDEAA